MNLSDEELTSIREAQLILADYIHPGPRDPEKTLNDLLSLLDRDDVVEAVDRSRPALDCVWPKTQKPRHPEG